MTIFVLVPGMFTGAHVWQETADRLTAAVPPGSEGPSFTDRYRARFRYSFRIDGLGNISGTGNGSYQEATWHLSGTNGSLQPMSHIIPEESPPLTGDRAAFERLQEGRDLVETELAKAIVGQDEIVEGDTVALRWTATGTSCRSRRRSIR